jgi:hypothetical protein
MQRPRSRVLHGSRGKICRALLAVIGSLAALVAATTMATATGNASSVTGTPARFAAQARQIGLTVSQAHDLQAQVNSEIAASGGVQTGLNKISYADGEMLLPLPGEARARDLAAPTADPAHVCPSKRFCAYSGRNYTGSYRNWYQCGTYKVPFRSGGSWYNNQTPGTIALMENSRHRVIFSTLPAPTGDPHGDWRPVSYVRNC